MGVYKEDQAEGEGDGQGYDDSYSLEEGKGQVKGQDPSSQKEGGGVEVCDDGFCSSGRAGRGGH